MIGPLAATSMGLPDIDLALPRAESRENSFCSPKQILLKARISVFIATPRGLGYYSPRYIIT